LRRKLLRSTAFLRAASVGYDMRIVFRFVEHEGEEALLLLTLGSHDEVY
jgi:mRNA-degrading endonuclease YafQ of YafQ-DinJ toxin-antitoxin module